MMKNARQQFEFYRRYIAFGNCADLFKTEINSNNLNLKLYQTYN